MKAYTLYNQWHEIKTGQCMVNYSFALPHKSEVHKTRIFDDNYALHAYLSADKMQWFKLCIETFLNENKKENEAYKLCTKFYNALEAPTTELAQACNSFLRGIDHFTNILPAIEDQPAHTIQTKNLNELIIFCQQETAN